MHPYTALQAGVAASLEVERRVHLLREALSEEQDALLTGLLDAVSEERAARIEAIRCQLTWDLPIPERVLCEVFEAVEDILDAPDDAEGQIARIA